MARYLCDMCGYIYDEETGAPGDGTPAGTRWEDLPEDWVCPDCGAPKQLFVALDSQGTTA